MFAQDPAERAIAYSFSLVVNEDNIPKLLTAINATDQLEARMQLCATEIIPKFLANIDQKLSKPDFKKFIAGNELCLYDMAVGGLQINLLLNPKDTDAAIWQEVL